MKVRELFEVQYGINLELVNCEITTQDDPNGVAFVARTAENNGVVAYVKRVAGMSPQPAGVLTCAAGGSVLSTFVQVRPFYSGRDLYILTPKRQMSLSEKLFYCMCIRANAYRYSYGRQANRTLPELELPDRVPAWANAAQIVPIATQITRPPTIPNPSDWKEFLYAELFDIRRGESVYLIDCVAGDIPYASASSQNNGISAYTNLKNREGNCIVVNYDGSIGDAFYQPGPFFASEKVVTLTLKHRPLNQYIAMFLITLIKAERYRFSYGSKWTVNKRMPNSVIRLPAKDDGSPDFDFMERHIRSLPYSDRI